LRSAQAKLRHAHARQKSLNASLVKSTSWRLTAPLRSAIDACRTLGDRMRKAVRRGVASSPEAAAFHRDGFIAPVDLLTSAQCELILKHYWLDPRRDQRRGRNALGATDRLFSDIATRPALLQLLKTILGDDTSSCGGQESSTKNRAACMNGTPILKARRLTAVSFRFGSASKIPAKSPR
jgi:hypothetical protein